MASPFVASHCLILMVILAGGLDWSNQAALRNPSDFGLETSLKQPFNQRDPRPGAQFRAIAFSPTGDSLFSIDELGNLVRHDTESYQSTLMLSAFAGTRACFAFEKNCMWLVSGSPEANLSLVELDTRKLTTFSLQSKEPANVTAIACTPNCKWIIAGTQSKSGSLLSCWDSMRQSSLWTLNLNCEFRQIAISPDGTMALAATTDNATSKTLLIDLATGRWSDFPSTGSILQFSPDSRMVLATGDDMLDVWELASRKKRQAIRICPPDSQLAKTYAASFTTDCRSVVSVTMGQPPKIWNIATGNLLKAMDAEETKTWQGLAVSPDGRLLASFANDVLFLWDASNGKTLMRRHTHRTPHP